MNQALGQPVNFYPFLLYMLGVLFVIAFMYIGSYFLGQRHKGKETDTPFESGIKATGTARIRVSARFYLVAMLFVIFDLEVAFLVGWAIAARELGWHGYWVMVIFAIILIAGLIYEWRMGALDWFREKGRAVLTGDRQR